MRKRSTDGVPKGRVRLRKALSLLSLVCLYLTCPFGTRSGGFAAAGDIKLIASDSSDRYHLSTCKIAQKIRPGEVVVFQTPEEAWEGGYVPCKKCNPPVPKDKEGGQKFNFGARSKTFDDPTI